MCLWPAAILSDLMHELPVNGDVFEAFISPDSSRVVFRADAVLDNVFELFSVPLAGGVASVRLNNQLAERPPRAS